MIKHRLLVYDQISRRMRWRLVLLLIILVLIGVYDRLTGYLGSLWIGWWLAIILVSALLFYYAILMKRTSILIRKGSFRLQGPIVGYNISYARIKSIASTNMQQHYDNKRLSWNERAILKPFYFSTCLFIELSSAPRRFKSRRLWFRRILFSPKGLGLICHVEDWMALSQQLEQARSQRDEAQEQAHIISRKTLVGRILSEDIDFKDQS